jgi:hypothetical protein
MKPGCLAGSRAFYIQLKKYEPIGKRYVRIKYVTLPFGQECVIFAQKGEFLPFSFNSDLVHHLMSTKRYTVASVCRYAIVAVVLLSAFSQLGAQPWLAPTTEGATFFDIKQSFDQYWDGRKPDKGKGFKAFKRWEQYWRYRVNEDGTFPALMPCSPVWKSTTSF